MADRWDGLADDIARGAQESFVRRLTEVLARMLSEAVESGVEPDRAEAERAAMGVWAECERGVESEVEGLFAEAVSEEDAGFAAQLAAAAMGALGAASAAAHGSGGSVAGGGGTARTETHTEAKARIAAR